MGRSVTSRMGLSVGTKGRLSAPSPSPRGHARLKMILRPAGALCSFLLSRPLERGLVYGRKLHLIPLA